METIAQIMAADHWYEVKAGQGMCAKGTCASLGLILLCQWQWQAAQGQNKRYYRVNFDYLDFRYLGHYQGSAQLHRADYGPACYTGKITRPRVHREDYAARYTVVTDNRDSTRRVLIKSHLALGVSQPP